MSCGVCIAAGQLAVLGEVYIAVPRPSAPTIRATRRTSRWPRSSTSRSASTWAKARPAAARFPGYEDYRASLTSPFLLEDVLRKHPKLRIYVMHYASPLVDEMIAMMFTHPNLYVDVSCNNWGFPRAQFHDALKRMVDAGFGKRIMFGSDQMYWPDAIGEAIRRSRRRRSSARRRSATSSTATPRASCGWAMRRSRRTMACLPSDRPGGRAAWACVAIPMAFLWGRR